MKRLAILSLLLLSGLVPGPAIARSVSAAGQDFLILYSNNVNGEIEPCG